MRGRLFHPINPCRKTMASLTILKGLLSGASGLVVDLEFYVLPTSTYTSTVVLCYSPLNILAQLL